MWESEAGGRLRVDEFRHHIFLLMKRTQREPVLTAAPSVKTRMVQPTPNNLLGFWGARFYLVAVIPTIFVIIVTAISVSAA